MDRPRAPADRIVERLPELTPQLALGARFIVDHPDSMVMSSMREIAGRVGVAPATLLRLARLLGYEDWSDFREVYVEHFRSSSPHYAEKADALTKRQGVPGLVEEVGRAQVAALQYAAATNSADTVDAAAKTLNRAERIFVAAFMSCRAPGLAFTYLCRLFRSNVALLGSEGASLAADLADLRAGDVVLSINFVPYSREIRLVAEGVARSGVPLVCIADSRVTPLSSHATSILLFAAESPSFFPSITGAVALVESLGAAMLAQAGEGAVGRVGAIERALYSSGSYDNG
ncbi:MAG TPA: MurR/RpiR family transcriptional regulator [Steroidobacteraceae bacterium]|nr:MurR/RpiR family transcriptional regulator [Steroidobacteraceae bacterium]